LRFLHQNSIHISFLLHANDMPRPIMSFGGGSNHETHHYAGLFILLFLPHFLVSIYSSEHHESCSSLNVRNQVSHLYKLYLIKVCNYCRPCISSGLTPADIMSSMKIRRPSNQIYGCLALAWKKICKCHKEALYYQSRNTQSSSDAR
jgi:hypothetical protein